MSPSILGFGQTLVDLLYQVPGSFLAEGKHGKIGDMSPICPEDSMLLRRELGKRGKRVQGGSIGNFLIGLGMLGGNCAALTKIGRDDAGQFLLSCYRDAKVCTEGVLFSEDLPTGHCISMVTPDAERTMRTCHGAAGDFRLEEINEAQFNGHTHMLLDGYMLYDPKLVIKALELGRAANLEIHIDLGSAGLVSKNRELLRQLIGDFSAVVYANENEAMALTGQCSAEEALRQLSRLSPLAVVKIGGNGALLKPCKSSGMHIPAVKVKAVDSTGAGDLWAAGFMYGYTQSWSLESAARLAAEVAAEVVQVSGAHIPPEGWARLQRTKGAQWAAGR